MSEMKEEDKLKLNAKLDEMKKKRAGKAQQLDIIIENNNKALNFQHSLNEMRQLCEMHGLIPDEVSALASQLQWLAMNVANNQKLQQFQNNLQEQLNQMFNPKEKTHEEKVEEKKAQEVEDGVVRVKPGEVTNIDIVKPKEE